ncbi:LuxR C-terminal-related transcriptional regulator [Actinomycetota bacterium]
MTHDAATPEDHLTLARSLASLEPAGHSGIIARNFRAGGDAASYAAWVQRAAQEAHGDFNDSAGALEIMLVALRDWETMPEVAQAFDNNLAAAKLRTSFFARIARHGEVAVGLAEEVLASPDLDEFTRAAALIEHSAALREVNLAESEQVVGAAVEAIDRLPASDAKAELLAMLCAELTFFGRDSEAERLSAEALEMLSDEAEPWIGLVVRITRADALALSDPDLAAEEYAASRVLADEIAARHPAVLVWYLLSRSSTFLRVGAYDEAVTSSVEGQTFSALHGLSTFAGAELACTTVEALFARGRVVTQSPLVTLVLGQPMRARDRMRLDYLNARMQLVAGAPEDAEPHLRRLAQTVAHNPPPATMRALWEHARSEHALATLEPAEAAAVCVDAAGYARGAAPAQAWPLLCLAARALRSAGAAPGDPRVSDIQSLRLAMPPVCDAAVGRWRLLLDAELESLSGPAEEAWRRARHAFAASEGPEETTAYVYLEHARAAIGAGDLAAAQTSYDAGSALVQERRYGSLNQLDADICRALGNAPAETAQRSLGLTRREYEVLQLLATGIGNREIAVRLQISPRTADVHVSRILAKLGASSRGQATAIAMSAGALQLSDITQS